MGDNDDIPFDIEDENNASDDTSDDDKEYDEETEVDKGDPNEFAYDDTSDDDNDDKEYEADQARPINDKVVVVEENPDAQLQIQQANTSQGDKGALKRKRGRGPTKGIRVTEPMSLEYDSLGQPHGKWRRQYTNHIGICMRKIPITYEWKDVSPEMLSCTWKDTMTHFNLEDDDAKKKVFIYAIRDRLRDFKNKLVSGWISKTRPRTKVQKKKAKRDKEKETQVREEGGAENDGEDEEEEQKMSYDIYSHITPTIWTAFVAKMTSPQVIAKREKNRKSSCFFVGRNPL